MTGVLTRARIIAADSDPVDTLRLSNTDRVRKAANICRLNSTYAQRLDTLRIRLDHKEFRAVVDYINTILRHSVNLGVLILYVDRPSKTLQRRVFDGVRLPHLIGLRISASFGETLPKFLRQHQGSLRWLRFLNDNRIYAPPPPLPVAHFPYLALTEITGSIPHVANVLTHCTQRALTLRLGGTDAKMLNTYRTVFRGHYITSLDIVLSPEDYDVVRELAAHFPHLYSLKIAESMSTNDHVWMRSYWLRAIRAHASLTRLSLTVRWSVDPDELPVEVWFPARYPQMRDVELMKRGNVFLQAWRRDYASNIWRIV